MECRKIRNLLSAYHDDELSADIRPVVVEHVGRCTRCGEELAGFERLRDMSTELADPEPPAEIWTGIEAALEQEATGAPDAGPATNRRTAAKRWRLRVFVTAATVLIAMGVGWLGANWGGAGNHDHLAVNLEHYLEQFATSPEAAQNVLLTAYDGRPVDLAEAARRLGYQPAVANGLPAGYSVESMHLLEMPCCDCVQTVCRREDGKVFTIFEHDEEQPMHFGDCSRVDAECNGRPCSLIEAQPGVVASWKADGRQITLVGGSDLEDVTDLITHLQIRSTDA